MRKIIRQQFFFFLEYILWSDWLTDTTTEIKIEREKKKKKCKPQVVASTHGIVIMNQPSQCEHPIEANKQLFD